MSGQETHVEHAVGFVEHERLDVREIDVTLLRDVEQAPRRCDENVDAAAQLCDLRVDADAAEDDRRLQRHVFAVACDALADLRSELARRRAGSARAHGDGRSARRLAMSRSQQRQRESGRLAGAGLCAGHDVAACENDGNDFGLNGSGLGIALFLRQHAATRPKGREIEMTCNESSTIALPKVASAAEERSKGIGFLAAGAAGIGCAASGTDRKGAGMRGTIPLVLRNLREFVPDGVYDVRTCHHSRSSLQSPPSSKVKTKTPSSSTRTPLDADFNLADQRAIPVRPLTATTLRR